MEGVAGSEGEGKPQKKKNKGNKIDPSTDQKFEHTATVVVMKFSRHIATQVGILLLIFLPVFFTNEMLRIMMSLNYLLCNTTVVWGEGVVSSVTSFPCLTLDERRHSVK